MNKSNNNAIRPHRPNATNSFARSQKQSRSASTLLRQILNSQSAENASRSLTPSSSAAVPSNQPMGENTSMEWTSTMTTAVMTNSSQPPKQGPWDDILLPPLLLT